MLNFIVSEEQNLLINSLRKIIADHYTSDEHSKHLNSAGGFNRELWSIFAENGFFAIHLPESVGGLSGSLTDMALAMVEMGKGVVIEPVLSGPIFCGALIDKLGSNDQRNQWLPNIIDASKHISLAHMEKQSRFQIDKVDARFRQNGRGSLITGNKIFAMSSAGADAFIVSAVPAGIEHATTEDIRFFLVPADADGIVQQTYRLMDGTITNDLKFIDVVGEPMDGNFAQFEDAIAIAKIAACSEMVGIMERLFDDTLEYVKTRKQFGQPIGKFQVLQHRLSDHFAALEMCKSHLFRMCTEDTSSLAGQQQIAGAKSFISEQARNLAEDSVQMHGGMGTTDELIIGRGLKRIIVLSTLFGEAHIERSQFA